ncbi:hypothetical protein KP509_1Z325200 [Ceratopteris richardii]|nr:hypothetical protein KP509_1Z325200 [Ceratopteris richardii]
MFIDFWKNKHVTRLPFLPLPLIPSLPGNHNALTIVALWAPVVMIYLLDIQIWYTILSSIVGWSDRN